MIDQKEHEESLKLQRISDYLENSSEVVKMEIENNRTFITRPLAFAPEDIAIVETMIKNNGFPVFSEETEYFASCIRRIVCVGFECRLVCNLLVDQTKEFLLIVNETFAMNWKRGVVTLEEIKSEIDYTVSNHVFSSKTGA